jgi:small-conductance mechanosensitive channel
MLIRILAGGGGFWRAIAGAMLALLLVCAAPSLAQQPAETPAAALERIKAALDQIETALKAENLSVQALTELRGNIVGLRDELRAQIEQLTPRAAEISARLKQLGPPPAKDASPEAPAVAAEREQLGQNFRQIDGALKQARLLAVRTEQLSDRIFERRRALYARQLLARGNSALDPLFWVEAANGVPAEIRSLRDLVNWWVGDILQGGLVRIAAALLLLALIILAALAMTHWWLPRFGRAPRGETQLARARTALMVFACLAARTPLAVFASFQVLEAFGLMPGRVSEIGAGLIATVVAAAFGRAVARALFAPGEPARRIVNLDEHSIHCFHDHLIWSTRILAVVIFLQVLHKTLFAPFVMGIATNVLFATAIAAMLVHLVRCLRRAEIATGSEVVVRVPGARLAAWVIAAAIVFALIAGYAALAAFIALRTVVAATAIGALYLLLVTIDALFTEAMGPDSARARAFAGNLGVSTRSVGVLMVVLSAAIRAVLVLLAFIIIIGPWEVSTADLADSVQTVPLAIRIGEINISFRAILLAAAVFAVALLITRLVQRWLQRELLPRTAIEPSLQVSIGAIFGYAGAITALMLALGSLGIDLQKIAFVASALAVGIGFGLQSVVSNFVSGLILLAERPIRIGDAIVVGAEEGWVRRIRVRATEIETYDRASVIVPNSLLITGMVKNWTHANTMGRVIVKIGVGYDSDPDHVRETLLAIAGEHPQVLRSPPPRAFLVSFGDTALEFELRCVVGNVENSLSVKSDLNLAVLGKFRAARIAIPVPQREIRARREEEKAEGGAASA